MTKITHYGHSCFGVEMGSKHIVFDPFIKPNPLASHINFDEVKADYILVSHGHEDHIADLVELALKTEATVLCTFEIHIWLNKNGVKKTHPMNTGGSKTFEFGSVKMVFASHSSSLPDGSYGGNPCGFVLKSDEFCFYFAGDTALSKEMELIPLEFNLDLAILPIGDNFTMGYKDAFIAANFVNCNRILGMHYDTFDYIVIDKKLASEYFIKNGKQLILQSIGETLVF